MCRLKDLDDGLMGDLTPKKVQVTREKLEYRGKRFSAGLAARPGAKQCLPWRGEGDARSNGRSEEALEDFI